LKVVVELPCYEGPVPGMVFAVIPYGDFQMGSGIAGTDETPQHQVRLETFGMMTTEVTQAQWKAVMGTNHSWTQGDSLPVESITYLDAAMFVTKLNHKNPGKRYHLPSEAEWEYACRAGTTGTTYLGDADSNLSRIAWYKTNAGNKTHPVAKLEPNAWGLYDMLGNVWEWCEDFYHENYNGAPNDGSAWLIPDGDSRIMKGGSYYDDSRSCRCAERARFQQTTKKYHQGFRIAETIPKKLRQARKLSDFPSK
jgi:formylglycine-generating enzyme required for sulfatase activity